MTDDEWAANHKESVRVLFRDQLLDAIRPHIDVLGHEGQLTLDEIRSELLNMHSALPKIVSLYRKDKS